VLWSQADREATNDLQGPRIDDRDVVRDLVRDVDPRWQVGDRRVDHSLDRTGVDPTYRRSAGGGIRCGGPCRRGGGRWRRRRRRAARCGHTLPRRIGRSGGLRLPSDEPARTENEAHGQQDGRRSGFHPREYIDTAGRRARRDSMPRTHAEMRLIDVAPYVGLVLIGQTVLLARSPGACCGARVWAAGGDRSSQASAVSPRRVARRGAGCGRRRVDPGRG
jgi:hypothetical protein